ncbi:MAG TPA: amino acid adenylation domain-containing protein, partial [Thermoanaerobaculia bacterium]
YRLERGTGRSDLPPIGRPLPNAWIYVLDADLQPVAPGLVGEVWIGGDGLARGYLARPDLTAEKFAPDPFAGGRGGEGGRLYRTGDLGRYLPDGTLDFVGRADHQVKIRGFRIELGEIEAALVSHPKVCEAAVLTQEDGGGGKRLVAFAVPVGPAPEDEELEAYLGSKLPEYMVPTAFVWLEELPLTASGKVDRLALAGLDVTPVMAEEYVAPRTAVEAALAGVWSELLGVERVGVRDSFVQLGGHSLLGIQVLSRVRRLFGVEMRIRTLFESPTVEALARSVERAREEGEAASPELAQVPRTVPQTELPLSFAQARLWFLDRLQPGTSVYNVPVGYRLRGRLEPAALVAALGEIARRHEALRTRFADGTDGPMQVIEPAGAFSLPQVDLGSLPEAFRRREERRLSAAEAVRPFDLARGPLLRSLLLRLAEGEWLLVATTHHIVSDGWSVGVLARELETLYGAALSGGPSPLPELPVQYGDFALWQRQWLRGEVLERQLAYWRERLAGHAPVLELPADRPRPAVQTFRGAAEPVSLGAEVSAGLRALSRKSGTPLFMTVLSGFLALLHRSTSQTDLLVGTPSAGRSRVELEGLIGFFVNTLVLRTDLSGDPSFRELLVRARETSLGAYAHGELPFERVVEELAPERSLSHSPLLQVVFVLHTQAMEPPHLVGVEAEEVRLSIEAARFDLTVSLTETAAGLSGEIEYSRDLFDATTVRRFAGHLRTLLAGAAAQPEARVSELPLLSPAERDELLVEWNDTAREYPGSALVHELFAAQAQRRPEALAVVSGDRRLTYGELESRSNRLAHHLRSLGVGPDVVVGICMERTLERVVGIVATLKAGGAYASFDPAYPPERLALMLEDARVPVLLTERRFLERLPESTAAVVCLDTDLDGLAGNESRPPAVEVDPENLSYVIFTSGSTGRPKGVAIPHRGLLNLVRWYHETYGVTAQDVGTQVASPAFDVSIWELWPLLAAGAGTAIPDEETRLSSSRMVSWWREAGITLAFLPTPLADGILGEEIPRDLGVRYLVVGGDRLHRSPRPGTPFRLSNIYGPAEHSVVSTMSIVDPEARVTIGRALANARVHVLDAHLRPVPVGVAGELYVAGAGLARGYLWRPELTAERFLPDPFAALTGDCGARMYRTGDLVRRLPDGDLDFLGRVDHQVKLRGMRVELGEIESVLGRHSGVREAVVLVPEGRLTAYVVGVDEPQPSIDELRGFLERQLPSYMVPQSWALLAALPLTPNSKLDRRALEGIAGTSEPSVESVAPRTPVEEALAQIWVELLGLERVGVRESFFHLGGHSLLATQVLSRVRRLFGVELSLRTLFEAPTVETLARAIE